MGKTSDKTTYSQTAFLPQTILQSSSPSLLSLTWQIYWQTPDRTRLALDCGALTFSPPCHHVLHRSIVCRPYFPATIRKWTLLPATLRNIQCCFDFVRQVWQRFGAPEQPLIHYTYTEPKQGNIHHARLRIGFTTLNAHLFQIQHHGTSSPSWLWTPSRRQ